MEIAGTPSFAEYMHIGETTARFASVMFTQAKRWNIGANGIFSIDFEALAWTAARGAIDFGDEVRCPQVRLS